MKVQQHAVHEKRKTRWDSVPTPGAAASLLTQMRIQPERHVNEPAAVFSATIFIAHKTYTNVNLEGHRSHRSVVRPCGIVRLTYLAACGASRNLGSRFSFWFG